MGKKTGSQTELHQFFCTKCGHEGIPIQRPTANKKEKKHLKKLFCSRCQSETNHCEIAPNGFYGVSDFEKDFVLGRFTL